MKPSAKEKCGKEKVINNVIGGNMKLKCDILQPWEEDIE